MWNFMVRKKILSLCSQERGAVDGGEGCGRVRRRGEGRAPQPQGRTSCRGSHDSWSCASCRSFGQEGGGGQEVERGAHTGLIQSHQRISLLNCNNKPPNDDDLKKMKEIQLNLVSHPFFFLLSVSVVFLCWKLVQERQWLSEMSARLMIKKEEEESWRVQFIFLSFLSKTLIFFSPEVELNARLKNRRRERVVGEVISEGEINTIRYISQ